MPFLEKINPDDPWPVKQAKWNRNTESVRQAHRFVPKVVPRAPSYRNERAQAVEDPRRQDTSEAETEEGGTVVGEQEWEEYVRYQEDHAPLTTAELDSMIASSSASDYGAKEHREAMAEITRLEALTRKFKGLPDLDSESQPEPESFNSALTRLFAEGEAAFQAKDGAKQKEIQASIAELERGHYSQSTVGGEVFQTVEERDQADRRFKAGQVARYRAEAEREFDKQLESVTKRASEVSYHQPGARPKTEDQIAAQQQAWKKVQRFNEAREEFIQDAVQRRQAEHDYQLKTHSSGPVPVSEPTIPDQNWYEKDQFESIMRSNPKRGWEILNSGKVRFDAK